VTDSSSGIGKATAHQLQQAGFITYARARQPDQLNKLVAAGCCPLALDLTREFSLIAVEQITRLSAQHTSALSEQRLPTRTISIGIYY
jgi:NADP-dependent 3-hydroxy acid dehydrogenase YdfG